MISFLFLLSLHSYPFLPHVWTKEIGNFVLPGTRQLLESQIFRLFLFSLLESDNTAQRHHPDRSCFSPGEATLSTKESGHHSPRVTGSLSPSGTDHLDDDNRHLWTKSTCRCLLSDTIDRSSFCSSTPPILTEADNE